MGNKLKFNNMVRMLPLMHLIAILAIISAQTGESWTKVEAVTTGTNGSTVIGTGLPPIESKASQPINATASQPMTKLTQSGDAISSKANTTMKYIQVEYHVDKERLPYQMNMSDSKQIEVALIFDKDFIAKINPNSVSVHFEAITLSPQFNILLLGETSRVVNLTKEQILSARHYYLVNLTLNADYIGHAMLKPTKIYIQTALNKPVQEVELNDQSSNNLHVVVVQYEGVWGLVFIISVSLLIAISYINLGAQLDTENMKNLIKRPKTAILGFMITVMVMPLASWFAGQWLLSDQLLFRLGSFVFACGPAASASTLWAAMLNSDKELSVSLQVISTLGALFTMPLLLYFMEYGLQLSATTTTHTIKVPYIRLIQTLFTLLVALVLGWHQLGRNERLQKYSRLIFKPLTFFVLLFIIIFSSILYWHIYRMFDRQIFYHALLVALVTYILTGLLGYLINCDGDHAIAISIGSAYKNSGIAFAVLLVAFDSPDTYIAYVPCLAQVITTSVILYLVYCIQSLVNCVRRRDQPKPIRATKPSALVQPESPVKNRRSASDASGPETGDLEQEESFGVDVDVVTAPSNNDTSPARSSIHV